MRKNTALATWRAGGQTIGAWMSTANTHAAELLAHAGFDWICVDLQHGLIDYGDWAEWDEKSKSYLAKRDLYQHAHKQPDLFAEG